MEAACAALERQFRASSNALLHVHNLVDQEWDEAASGPNPERLAERLERLAARVQGLETEWAALEERKAVEVPRHCAALLAERALLDHLVAEAGEAALPDPHGDVHAVAASAGGASATVALGANENASANDNANSTAAAAPPPPPGAKEQAQADAASAAARATARTASHPVTEAKFLAIAPSTRGRAKFENVKQTYATIVSLWRKRGGGGKARHQGGLDPVTVKEMSEAGLAGMAGTTGRAVLACLVKLNAVRQDRAGFVPVPLSSGPSAPVWKE